MCCSKDWDGNRRTEQAIDTEQGTVCHFKRRFAAGHTELSNMKHGRWAHLHDHVMRGHPSVQKDATTCRGAACASTRIDFVSDREHT